MAFPDPCLWRQGLHRHIFCVSLHANDWILLHSEKGLDKPLTHVKTDCGLGFLGSMPALGTRRTSGTRRSILSAATMTASCTTAFSPPVSCARFSFKPNYSPQFHLSESSHKLLLLALRCLPFISTSLPSKM